MISSTTLPRTYLLRALLSAPHMVVNYQVGVSLFVRGHIPRVQKCVAITNTQLSNAQVNDCEGLGVRTLSTEVAILFTITGN